MRDILLHDAYNLIRQSAGVLLEGRFVEPHLFDIEEDYSNEWMTLQWVEEYDGEELDVVVDFKEGDNQKVVLDSSSLILVNSDGEEEELIVLSGNEIIFHFFLGNSIKELQKKRANNLIRHSYVGQHNSNLF